MNRDINLFESVFKRALRKRFEFASPDIRTVLLIADLEGAELDQYERQVRDFLHPVLPDKTYHLEIAGGGDFSNWADLSRIVTATDPHLIVSYRLLRVAHEEILTSLGVYIDALSQITDQPILVLPNPHLFPKPAQMSLQGRVIVATEHLYEDHSLVNYGIRFTPLNGALNMVHIEDLETFEYYMSAIEKIPEMNTIEAREVLENQLKAGPRHYNESVREILKQERPDINLNEIIDFGHLITKYKAIISDGEVNLLVFHTKDDTQLAMHSLGYSLAIEFKDIPVLLV